MSQRDGNERASMTITGRMIHEAFVYVRGGGLRWEELSEGSRACYGRMAQRLNGPLSRQIRTVQRWTAIDLTVVREVADEMREQRDIVIALLKEYYMLTGISLVQEDPTYDEERDLARRLEDIQARVEAVIEREEVPIAPAHPTIVCLCGSTRFAEAFHEANLRETLAGRIVLTVGCDFKSDADLLLAGQLAPADKQRLDELHLRKIDLADEILVLNVGNYIGGSTSREVAYARRLGKRVRYLVYQENDPLGDDYLEPTIEDVFFGGLDGEQNARAEGC